jgi:DNA (cytosine-5)-methyltransferase 1
MKNNFNFIDLFAGCGGLSEGFYQENFEALMHIEMDRTACETLKERMRYYNYTTEKIEKSIICDDITKDTILEQMDKIIDQEVDVIIGGPPCQAFSTVGRAQDPNSMQDDPRNYLFENYLMILNFYKPKFFVFENVKGLLTAQPHGVKIFNKIIFEMRKLYDVCDDRGTILLDAANYGVPQHRERVILIGVRKDIGITSKEVYERLKITHGNDASLIPFVTVRDAIGDLPFLYPGEGENIIEFTPNIVNDFLKKIRNPDFKYLYNHVARKHNEKDRCRYSLLSKNNWKLKDLALYRPDLIHHDPKHFGNRYTVQEYDKPGTTIVAHLYKDGNLFIHPDYMQERTFTPREAARIQSFPDDFMFAGSRTNQYKQIGNAVPPLMSRVLAKLIKNILNEIEEKNI